MTAIKGYVVRGTDRWGAVVVCCTESGATVRQVPPGIDPLFSSLDVANTARAAMGRRECTNVAIFRVHDNDTEEQLPSYEEALAEIERLRAEIGEAHDAIFEAAPQVSAPLAAQIRSLVADLTAPAVDPLAALEAAERRLLEAGGWVESGDKWTLADGDLCQCQAEAVAIERYRAALKARRLAAKGGA